MSDEPTHETSDDERYSVIRGRRWRRQDPHTPNDVREALLSHLGRGRSGVRNSGGAEETARHRSRVNIAKHGLGERGIPWWEQTDGERRARWESALRDLEAMDA